MKLWLTLIALAFAQPALADLQVMHLKVLSKKSDTLKVSVTPPPEQKRREPQIFTIQEATAYFRDLVINYDGAWVKIQPDGISCRKLVPILRSISGNRYVQITSLDGREVNLANLIKKIEQ